MASSSPFSTGGADSAAQAPHKPERPSRARRVPAWLLVGAGVLLFAMVVAVFLAVAFVMRPAARVAARGIQERAMPDGTVLVLEKVTTGTSHAFDAPRKQSVAAWLVGATATRTSVNAWAPAGSIVVWLSRRDPRTGDSLDFDWWQRSAAVDDLGWELEDDHAGRNAFSGTGSMGVSGTRPFSPVGRGGKYELIVAHSAFRPFRHGGKSFKLRIYDTTGKMVAEFDVPHEVESKIPAWTPEPLPATKNVGDLEVTISRLSVTKSELTEGMRKRPQFNIQPEYAVARDGRPAGNSLVAQFEYEDAFGNVGQMWDCRLNPHEPAWKLRFRLWLSTETPADGSREWSVPGIDLPAATKASLVRQTKTVGGVNVEFIAVGGGEKVVYTNSTPTGHDGSSSSSGTFGEARYEIRTETRGVGIKTTIDCKSPHLLLRVTGLDNDHQLIVLVQDDRGRAVPVQQAYASDQTAVFMRPEEDAAKIDVTFVVLEAKKVEFFVAPPEMK